MLEVRALEVALGIVRKRGRGGERELGAVVGQAQNGNENGIEIGEVLLIGSGHGHSPRHRLHADVLGYEPPKGCAGAGDLPEIRIVSFRRLERSGHEVLATAVDAGRRILVVPDSDINGGLRQSGGAAKRGARGKPQFDHPYRCSHPGGLA
jgi:hypothetical protein